MELTPAAQKFVLHWGEMGQAWGINRTMAQVHALLFISPRPLNAEEIAAALSIARSNVSTTLKELQSWGIVKVVHVLGDRRDHFVSLKDVWELFRQVLDERRKREIDPTLSMLRDDLAQARRAGSGGTSASGDDAYAREKLGELLDFFESTTAWYEQIRRMPTRAVIRFIKLGPKVRKMLGVA